MSQLPDLGGELAAKRIAIDERLAHLPVEPNPALVQHAEERAQSVQNRIADQITAFAGSMWFVYIHIVWFSCWIGLKAHRQRAHEPRWRAPQSGTRSARSHRCCARAAANPQLWTTRRYS